MALKRSAPPFGWYKLDKERPAVVISSNAQNRHSPDVCVVPISTAEHKAFPLRPRLAAGDGGLARDSWTRCDQVSTLEKATAVYPPLGVVNLATMERIQEAIKLALELP